MLSKPSSSYLRLCEAPFRESAVAKIDRTDFLVTFSSSLRNRGHELSSSKYDLIRLSGIQ